MAFQQNHRRYDAQGRWLLPSWMPYPTDGVDRVETRFAYGRLREQYWVKGLGNFVEYWADSPYPYVAELVDFSPTDAEREAHCIWDEPHVTRVIRNDQLAAAGDEKSLYNTLYELQIPSFLHPKIGEAVRVRAGSVFECRAITEDTFVNRALLEAFRHIYSKGWADVCVRLVTGSSRFSKFFYVNGVTDKNIVAGIHVHLDGEPVMEIRAVPDRRVVLSGLLPMGEAVYWLNSHSEVPNRGGASKRNVLSESSTMKWDQFRDFLACIFRRVDIVGPDGQSFLEKTSSTGTNSKVRDTFAYRSSAEASERGETFNKLSSFGRVEKFFLPSLRDPALWEHLGVLMSDVRKLKARPDSFLGQSFRESLDWTNRKTFD